MGMGVTGLVIRVLLFMLLPKRSKTADGTRAARGDVLTGAARALVAGFRDAQSILCGIIAGVRFLPTTIFDMTWGVRYFEEAHGFDYATAVLRSASVPFGWVMGCPRVGFVSGRI